MLLDKCPLCGGDIGPDEIGPVDHLMKSHKRGLYEATQIVNLQFLPDLAQRETRPRDS